MSFSGDRAEAVANFIKLGRSLGVETATFRAQEAPELGLFEGYLCDDVIFKYSLIDGFPWSYALQDFLLTKIFLDSSGARATSGTAPRGLLGRGTYLDVGANIGLIVTPIAEKGGIQCYAFEPEPSNYALLCRNIAAHHVESLIKTWPIALFSEKTSMPFELSARNDGDHRIRPHQPSKVTTVYGEEKRSTIQVNAERLDDLLDVHQLKKPVVLKVDIEGTEVHFSRGATGFLQGVDYLVIECSPYQILRFGDTLDAFLEIVEQFPFAAVVDFVDRVRSVHFDLKPAGQIIQQIRNAVNPTQIDQHQEFNIVCSRQPCFPADMPAVVGQ